MRSYTEGDSSSQKLMNNIEMYNLSNYAHQEQVFMYRIGRLTYYFGISSTKRCVYI